jgi:hypothetical protein
MKVVKSFEAKINIGLKEGYDGIEHDLSEVENICQQYCNKIGYAVTVQPTKFVYKNGNESGCVIGLINYPRFPSTEEEIIRKAFEIGREVAIATKQLRFSIVCSDKTYMLEKGEDY